MKSKSLPVAMGQPPSWSDKLRDNVDRPGMSYKSYVLSSADPQLCANDCANDPNCKAFTYVKPGFRSHGKPECWLKNGVPDAVSSECCISGVRGEVTTFDWNNIPGLVLHLYHNVNQGAPDLGPIRSDLYFFAGHDLGGSEGEGYCWWQVPDNPNADPADWSKKLPSGIVLALKHQQNQGSDPRLTAFGLNPSQYWPPYKYTFLNKQNGGDMHERG
ncbi:MAG: PAN domain-containing protein [Methanotrichaceae archaeon]|nr:PAN domain-containing protein [Methanotrichaceae archaeon]